MPAPRLLSLVSTTDSTPASPRAPRPGLALVAALHALVFAVAAVELPWPSLSKGSLSWAAVLLGLVAVAHGALAVSSAFGKERWVRPLWMGLSVTSLVLWLGTALWVVGVGAYLHGLYRGIGAALAGGLFVLLAVLALFTVPFAIWGLAVTRPWARRKGVARGVGVAVLLLCVVVPLGAQARGKAFTPSPWGETSPEELWRRVVDQLPELPREQPTASRPRLQPLSCDQAITAGGLTALLSWVDGDGKFTARCVRAEDPATLESRLVALLRGEPYARLSTAVDFVTAHRELRLGSAVLAPFELRPAQDGVCAGARCLTPWQLVARDSFTKYEPVRAVPDAKIGVDPRELRQILDAAPEEPLVRIETETYSLVNGKVERLSRLHRLRREPDEKAVRRAVRAAERHIVAAQESDGRFRYLLHPFTGQTESATVNLPRQAGTTLVLCELGTTRDSRRVVGKALDLLARYERRSGALSVLTTDSNVGPLGQTALPLVAFLSCRPEQGARHDELIARLGAALLHMQRSDGSFAPLLHLKKGEPEGTHQPLYAAGQAVLALVLLEQRLGDLQVSDRPDAARVRAAIDRAMSYYAESYWPRTLREFFYVEENWHCLAARAALSSHRHDAYERFCLDYVTFKERFILGADEVEPDRVGGYGVGPLFEPHNTASAGFGEALAAALAVARARGEDTTRQEGLLRDVLGFLVRAQWDAASCFACGGKKRALGGFSEHAGSPLIRIDYVQHAMAALGHGGRELFSRS